MVSPEAVEPMGWGIAGAMILVIFGMLYDELVKPLLQYTCSRYASEGESQ